MSLVLWYIEGRVLIDNTFTIIIHTGDYFIIKYTIYIYPMEELIFLNVATLVLQLSNPDKILLKIF